MSYWIPTQEDYDRTIIELLSTIQIDGKPITVTHAMPEHEGGMDIDLQRPAIAFYSYDRVLDITREQSYLTEIVSDNSQDVTTTETPTPIIIFYQFNVITEFKVHENEIIAQFERLFPYRGYIMIKSADGSKEADYDFFMKQFINRDTNQEVPNGGTSKKRIFEKIYRYHLYTEMSQQAPSTYKKVQEIDPKIQEMEGNNA